MHAGALVSGTSPRLPLPPAALGDVEQLEVGALLLEQVPRHPAQGFQPQELSNIVWAMGTLGLLHEAAIDHLLGAAGMHMAAFIPQALSNMVWACAHLRNGTRGCLAGGTAALPVREARPGWQPPPAFLQAVATASTRLMPDFQSQVRAGGRGGGGPRGLPSNCASGQSSMPLCAPPLHLLPAPLVTLASHMHPHAPVPFAACRSP